MEPGTPREKAAGAGYPKPTDLREETPGEEAKGGDGTAVMLRQRGGDEAVPVRDVKAAFEHGGDAGERIKTAEEEDAGKYEEELDPRIQA